MAKELKHHCAPSGDWCHSRQSLCQPCPGDYGPEIRPFQPTLCKQCEQGITCYDKLLRLTVNLSPECSDLVCPDQGAAVFDTADTYFPFAQSTSFLITPSWFFSCLPGSFFQPSDVAVQWSREQWGSALGILLFQQVISFSLIALMNIITNGPKSYIFSSDLSTEGQVQILNNPLEIST